MYGCGQWPLICADVRVCLCRAFRSLFFDFPKGKECVLYLKKGYDTVPMVVEYDQFLADHNQLCARRRDLELSQEAEPKAPNLPVTTSMGEVGGWLGVLVQQWR